MRLAVQITDAHVADCIRIARHSLNDTAVRSLQERALAHTRFAHDELLEGFVRARRAVTADHDDRRGRAAKLLPVRDLAREDVAKLLHREGLHRILRIHDRNDGVVCNGIANRLNAMRFEFLRLLRLHVARGHGHIGHAVKKRLDAVAGARAGDRYGHI